MSGPGLIAFPPTATTVTFPFDNLEGKFDSSFYKPEYTDGRASEEEINTVLRDLDAVIHPLIVKLNTSGRNVVISQGIFVVLAILCWILSQSVHPYLVWVGCLCFIYATIAPCTVLKSVLTGINKELYERSQAVVEKHNQNFSSRGLRWDLSAHFPKRIELRKDYNNQGAVDHVTIDVAQQSLGGQQYVPPSQF